MVQSSLSMWPGPQRQPEERLELSASVADAQEKEDRLKAV